MSTIDIRTTQNVTIEYELATLRERMFAALIDLAIVVAMYIAVIFVVIRIEQSGANWEWLVRTVLIFFPFVGFMSYHLLAEMASNGQSWGKRALGIRVVRLDGREPGFGDYFLRAVFHLIDSLLSAGILAALLISTSGKNQRLGDMTANTTVIRARHYQRFKLSDILKISTLGEYQPHYTAVRKLSEQDLLLVKNAIGRYQSFPNAAHQQAINELSQKLKDILEIDEIPRDKIAFLKTLIRDYIVLTR